VNLKQLTKKMKVESTKLKRQLEAAPALVKKTFDAEAKKLEAAPAKVKKAFDAEVKKLEAAPAKMKKAFDAEVKKLEAAPTKVKKALEAEAKKLEKVPAKLAKQIEELPGKAADAVGIVRSSQLKQVKAEIGKLSKRVDALTKSDAAA
jgi:hypothetical protein